MKENMEKITNGNDCKLFVDLREKRANNLHEFPWFYCFEDEKSVSLKEYGKTFLILLIKEDAK